MFLVALFCLMALLSEGEGHGMMMFPTQRSSLWREGFDAPKNDNDNEVFCGGIGKLHKKNKGKCGICGDDWSLASPRPHEAGGKWGRGIIAANFTEGETVDVKIHLTTAHKGWFEFRLCVWNKPTKVATHQCLDKNLLELPDEGGTRFTVPKDFKSGWFTIPVKLPAGITCSQCILQWFYRAGNNWGVDPDTGKSGIGYGEQEYYINCADIAIK